jgi:hypothetical protein
VGAIPWFVDARRFGGPSAALERIRELTHSEPTFALAEHLRLIDGPLVGPDTSGQFPWQGLLWWLVLAVLVVAGLIWSKGERRRAAIAATITGAFLAAPYIFLTGVSAPRFLTPAYALLVIPAALGFQSAVKRLPSRASVVAVLGCIALLVAWTGWQLWVAGKMNYRETKAGESAIAVGTTLDRIGGNRCAFAIAYGVRPVEFASSCVGLTLVDGDTAPLSALREQDYRVFLVIQSPPIEGDVLTDWKQLRHRRLKVRTGWSIYAPRDQT